MVFKHVVERDNQNVLSANVCVSCLCYFVFHVTEIPFLFPAFFIFILFICLLFVFLHDTAFQTHRIDVFISLIANSDIPASIGELQ